MKKIIYFLVIIAVVFGLYKLLSIPPKNNISNYDNPDLIFYWGEGCPHCKNVEKWVKDNNANQKLKINQKEIYKNIQNQKEMTDLVKQYCSDLVGQNGIGIPLGFDPVNKKCISGDQPIIDFLSSKIK